MAKEYIDREALLDNLCGVCSDEYGDSTCEPDDCFIVRVINEQPTADVVEVRHGEWVDRYGNKYDNHLYDCSECHAEALLVTLYDELGSPKIVQDLSLYCPNCGAKMDGKGEGE